MKLKTTSNTYSIQQPPDCAVSPTHQNLVLMYTPEEVESTKQSLYY